MKNWQASPMRGSGVQCWVISCACSTTVSDPKLRDAQVNSSLVGCVTGARLTYTSASPVKGVTDTERSAWGSTTAMR
jgi:hypothetical protein